MYVSQLLIGTILAHLVGSALCWEQQREVFIGVPYCRVSLHAFRGHDFYLL